MGTTRKPCKCCKVKCCAFGPGASLPFTPDVGWTLESVVINNTGTQNCIGRAVVDIVLSKPALSPASCSNSVDYGCGVKCGNGFWYPGTLSYPGSDMAESLALFNAWLAKFPLPAGWVFDFPIDNIVSRTGYTCATWIMDGMGGNVLWYCPSECSNTSSRHHMFRYDVPADERYYSTQAARDAAAQARYDAFITAFNAWWASDAPSIKWTKGSCEYELVPNRSITPFLPPSSSSFTCLKYIPTNPPSQRWVFCTATMRTIGNLYWSVLCASNPCTMSDYSWPMTLPCTCQSHYLDSDLTTIPPPCTLYLMSTSREWAGDKCLFKAKYGGAIAAGIVTCPPGTTDENCICCEEPAP